ncbi:MAG: hypothetical protein ACYDEJ_10190 [Desulfitobacteriaceae bacterium]
MEEELRRFGGYQNRENTFQLARIDEDINHASKRITLAKEEKVTPNASPYVAQYSDLEKELEKLSSERTELAKSTTTTELTPIQLIRDRLKDFASRIRIEPPNIQHFLMKQYIDTIVLNEVESKYKVQFHIDYPSGSDEKVVKILEKTAYIKLN